MSVSLGEQKGGSLGGQQRPLPLHASGDARAGGRGAGGVERGRSAGGQRARAPDLRGRMVKAGALLLTRKLHPPSVVVILDLLVAS